MAANIFQSFWYGSSLSPREWLCVSSFVQRGQDFHLYTYDDTLAVPEGVILKDASEIYPEDDVFFYQHGPGKGSVSAFSNIFRYKLLHSQGGWWVDMDVIYTGNPLPERASYFGWQDQSTINCAIMRFEPGSSIMHACLKQAEGLGKNINWGEAGPNLLTQIIEEENKLEEAYSQVYSYPVEWRDAPDFYNPDCTEEIEQKIDLHSVPFVHIWNEILKRCGIQKNIAPPFNSYLHKEAVSLEIPWPYSEVRYSANVIEQMISNYQEARKARKSQDDDSYIRKAISKLRQTLG